MMENKGATVTLQWATTTSLHEQNISNLKWNQRFPSPLPPSPAAKKAKSYFIFFSTSSLVETVFQWVNYILSEVPNCPDVRRGVLHLSLTTLEPNTQKLESVHQTQGTQW